MASFYAQVRLKRETTGSKLTSTIELNYYPDDLEEICLIVKNLYPDWEIDFLEIYKGVPHN